MLHVEQAAVGGAFTAHWYAGHVTHSEMFHVEQVAWQCADAGRWSTSAIRLFHVEQRP